VHRNFSSDSRELKEYFTLVLPSSPLSNQFDSRYNNIFILKLLSILEIYASDDAMLLHALAASWIVIILYYSVKLCLT
jgi:hypothetical protein